MALTASFVKVFQPISNKYISAVQSVCFGTWNFHRTKLCTLTTQKHRCHHRFVTSSRTFSTSYELKKNEIKHNSDNDVSAKICETQSTNDDAIDIRTLLESWYYEVCNRGSLTATLPFQTHIKPLNPQLYPDMNKVILHLHFDPGKSSEVPTSFELSEITDLYNLQVGFDEDKANMNLSCEVIKGLSLPIVCTLQVPLHFDLKIQMYDDADVSVEKLESKTVFIETDKGNCELRNLKCGSVTSICQSGSILSSPTLLGNVHFHTGKAGSIQTGKLQGSNVSCETAMGPVSVKSLYTENATFRSDAGDIHLGNCHGQLCVQAEQSHLKVESLEGDLDASLQTGSVSVHFSKHNKANIELRTGDITLSFPEGASSDLNLDSPNVAVDESIKAHLDSQSQPHHMEGYIGERGSAVQVNARTLSGRIHLKQMDWLQTTQLSALMREENGS